MMCQQRSIRVTDVHSGGGVLIIRRLCICGSRGVWGRGVGKSLYLPLSFVMEPKTALKTVVFKKQVIELYMAHTIFIHQVKFMILEFQL